MCLASSFFSITIEAQLASGATHDIRIFTGSPAALPTPIRPSAQVSANLRNSILSSPFVRALWFRCRIVGGPMIFFKRRRCDALPSRGRLGGFLVPDQQ